MIRTRENAETPSVSQPASGFTRALAALREAGVEFVVVGVGGINFYARTPGEGFATVDLGLAAPFVPAFAGFTDMNGDASLTVQLPSVVPAGTYYAQGVSAGVTVTPGTGISFNVCAATVASFTL